MADQDPVMAAIRVDRSPPIGNSPGADGRWRAHVKIANESGEPIPFSFSQGFSTGTPAVIPVNATSTALLPANSARMFVSVANWTNTIVWVQLAASAVAGEGIRLLPGSRLVLAGAELWLGPISAISTTGSVNINLMEGEL